MSLLVTQLHISQQLDLRDLNCIRADDFLDRRFPTRTPKTFPPPPPSTPRLSSTERLPDMEESRRPPCVCMYDRIEMVPSRPLGRLGSALEQSCLCEAEKHYPCLLYNGAFRPGSEKSCSLISPSDVSKFRGFLDTGAGNRETDDKDALRQTGILHARNGIDLPQLASQTSPIRTSFGSKIDKPIRGVRCGWLGCGITRMIDGALSCLPQRKLEGHRQLSPKIFNRLSLFPLLGYLLPNSKSVLEHAKDERVPVAY